MNGLKILLALAITLVPLAAYAGHLDTIDDLVATYGDENCGKCHQDIYEQWKESPHAESVVLSLGGLRNFLVFGVRDWWGRDISKVELMKCLDCHAPAMKFATEELALKVADMIIAAKDSNDEKTRKSAVKELSRLNVDCISCHGTKATAIAIGHLGEPEAGAVYGIHGKSSPAHKTIKSAELNTALFCMQCHGNYTAPDGEVIKCNTLNGSYQDGYVSRGGSRTCQDCHIRARGRGHRMPGGRDPGLVREGIGFKVEIAKYLHLPGKGEKKWTPSALVNVELENRAGHRIPDG